MAKITLSVKQIINLGLWEKVCDYKGWGFCEAQGISIDQNELIDFDDEFRKDVKWELEYSECISKITEMSTKANELANGNSGLQDLINSLGEYAIASLKYEIIVRELEEYLDKHNLRSDFNDLREIIGNGLNLNFPDDF